VPACRQRPRGKPLHSEGSRVGDAELIAEARPDLVPLEGEVLPREHGCGIRAGTELLVIRRERAQPSQCPLEASFLLQGLSGKLTAARAQLADRRPDHQLLGGVMAG
jgi:hypothetical protein